MCSLLSGTCRGIYSSQLQEKAARTELPSEQQSEHLCITSKPHSKETLSSGPVFLMAYIPVSVWDLQVLDYNRLFLSRAGAISGTVWEQHQPLLFVHSCRQDFCTPGTRGYSNPRTYAPKATGVLQMFRGRKIFSHILSEASLLDQSCACPCEWKKPAVFLQRWEEPFPLQQH